MFAVRSGLTYTAFASGALSFLRIHPWSQDLDCLDLFAGEAAITKGFCEGLIDRRVVLNTYWPVFLPS